jgi:two-component SAPR family response regulator
MCARKRFSDAVYYLRRALREAADGATAKFVQLRMDRYVLDRDLLDTDLWDFEHTMNLGRTATDDTARREQLQRAVDLYQGEFIHVGDGAWAEPFRQDLRRKAISALMEVARLVEHDNPGTAITTLERVLKLAPYDEEADRAIMRIHHRLRRDDAIRITYRALVERLAGLGEEPSSETISLLNSLIT